MYNRIKNNEVIDFKNLAKREYEKVPFKLGYCYFNKIRIFANIRIHGGPRIRSYSDHLDIKMMIF
jgi:hypothetical protein